MTSKTKMSGPRPTLSLLVTALLAVYWPQILCAQTQPPKAKKPIIQTVKVTPNIYVLMGQGGNVGVFIGEDGTFMIDDKFAHLSRAIAASVEKLSDKPIRFLLNTHLHGDHVGGNQNFANKGAIIVAHDNVRTRMSKKQFLEFANRRVPAAPKKALPVVTFNDKVSFHWNNDTIEVFHCHHAHTDGDVVVHFKKAKVFHMGDLFLNGRYPIIDISSGGSFSGIIKAGQAVLKKCDKDTVIIPGHGAISNPAGLKTWLKVIKTIQQRIQKHLSAGLSVDDIVAKKPSAEFDAQYGSKSGFMMPDNFIKIAAHSLKAENAAKAKKKAAQAQEKLPNTKDND